MTDRKAPSTRIARNSRTLPEFEEHRIVDGWWHFGAHQRDNWRSLPESAAPGSAFGQYECLDCGERHQLPGLGIPLVCAHLTVDEGRKRAIGRIEGRIARARGQYPKFSDAMLLGVAGEILSWAQYYPIWGRSILAEYRRHPVLEPYIAALEDTPLRDGDNIRPPPNAGELISSHLPLVRRLARERAAMNIDGEPVIDDVLFSDLENVGMKVLEEAVNRFDPTLGVTFGAFVRKRLAGAMDDWLTRERIRTVAGDAILGAECNSNWGGDVGPTTAGAPKRHRSSTGGYRERVYTESAVQRPPRLIPAKRGMSETIKAALERLNPRQREVYQGRVLSDPQVPRSELARRLGIKDDRQIPRIESQARAKIARFLKSVTPS